MIKKKITSMIMCLVFLTMTVMTSYNSINASAYTMKVGNTSIPTVYFVQKPLAEYIAGSNVNFKVASKTTVATTKVEYSIKLFNLDTNKKEMDVSNYGKATLGSSNETYSFTIKNSGSYRLAVYVRNFGTNGTISNYYDNYITNDFKVIKLDKVTKTLSSVDPINITAYLKTAYTLPTTVAGKMSDGTTKLYGVTWDKKASTTTLGTYTFKGTLKDLSTLTVIKNMTVKLTLTVSQLPVFDPITATADAYSDYKLPTSVDSKAVKGVSTNYAVTWDKPASTTAAGIFVYNGTVKDKTTAVVVKGASVKLTLKVNALPTFDSIVVTVDQRSNYVLPDKVNGKMSDGSVKQFMVTWDKQAGTTTPGAFTFTGAITDPTTSLVVKNAKVILTLNVKEVPVFEDMVYNVKEGEQFTLPTTAKSKMADGTLKTYNVVWDKAVDTTKVGTYNFVGSLKDINTAVIIPNLSVKLTLNVNPLQLQVVTAATNSSRSFKITFNKTVDYSKCNITAAMNGIQIPMAAAWESDGKSVLVQSQDDLAIGTYIIKISGIGLLTDAYTVEVKPLTLTSVAIPTVYLTPNNSAAKVLVNGQDQYNNSIGLSTSDFDWTVVDDTAKLVLQVTAVASNYLTIQTNLPGVKTGDKIIVDGRLKTDTSIRVSASLEINSKPIDKLTLNQPIISSTDKKLSVKSTDVYYEIPYNAVQNYIVNGVTSQSSAVLDDKTEASLDNAVTINNFIFVTDRSDVLTNIKVENGKLYVKVGANKSGTVKLTATSTTQQDNIYALTINIAGPSIPNSFILGSTSAVLTAGGSVVKVPITVYDQYGEAMAPEAFAKTNFTDFTIIIPTATASVATAVFGNDGKTLDVTPGSVGTSNLTIVNKNSGKTVVYTANVNAAAVVKGFTSSVDYTCLLKGAAAVLKLDTLDQYGNKIYAAPNTFKYAITANNGATNVKVSLNNVAVSNVITSAITLTGMTSGKTEAITVTLYNDTNNNNIVEASELIKAYAFNMNVLADNEQLIYAVNPIATAYAAVAQDKNNSGLNGDAYGAIPNQNNKNIKYAQKVTLNATRVDGTPVALASNPITGISATVNPALIDFAGKIGNDFYVIGRQWSGNEFTKDANLSISYTDSTGMNKSLNAKVTVSKESLRATTVKSMSNVGKDSDTSNDTDLQGAVVTLSYDDFNTLNGKKLIENQTLTGIPCYFEVDDQYGVSSINPVSYTVVSKQSILGAFTIDSNGVITTSGMLPNDSVTISAMDTEGHSQVITLKVLH